jgi:monoamine oxidase
LARTPLFDLVTRALREAHASNHTEIPIEELRARSRELTRRDALKIGGLAAAGALLTNCRTAVPASAALNPPVAIVGGGIAGLTAAYRLQQAGVPFELIEAQDRVGGRMWSLRNHFPDGQVVELGGELIDTGHESIRALASELAIELDDLHQEGPGIRGDIWYFGGAVRSEAEIVGALRPVAAAIEADLGTLSGDGDVTYDAPNNGVTLDRLSIAQWLDGKGVSGWIRTLLDVAYTTEFGLEIGEQSALNLLTMIDTSLDPFRIYGDSDERFHVRGGNDRIVSKLGELVSSHVSSGTVLESLRRAADGSLELGLRYGRGTRTMRASRVILALPFTLLREVDLAVELPAVKRLAIRELGYGTNAKLMTGFSQRLWRERDRSNGSVVADLPFQLVWETSRAQSGRSGVLTNFTGGRHGLEIGEGSEALQAAAVVRDLEKIFPGIAATRNDVQVRFHWPTFRWMRGSYASYRPGQWTTIRGAEGETVGDIFFAGEHCSLDFQGFMEGGCETGERAAAAVLESLGAKRIAA